MSWYALMVPAGTPADVIDRLAAETRRVLAQPETREKLVALGLQVGGGTPAQLGMTIDSESRRWAEVIRKQNIPLQ